MEYTGNGIYRCGVHDPYRGIDPLPGGGGSGRYLAVALPRRGRTGRRREAPADRARAAEPHVRRARHRERAQGAEGRRAHLCDPPRGSRWRRRA